MCPDTQMYWEEQDTEMTQGRLVLTLHSTLQWNVVLWDWRYFYWHLAEISLQRFQRSCLRSMQRRDLNSLPVRWDETEEQKWQGQKRLELWPCMLLCERTHRLGKGLKVKGEKDNAIKYSHGAQEISLEAVLQPGNRIILHEENK